MPGAKDKQSRHGESQKEDDNKYGVRDDLFKIAEQYQQGSDRALDCNRVRRGAEAGMGARNRLQKEAIVGHRIVNAGREDDERRQTSHQADDHDCRENHATRRSEQYFSRLGHEGLV